MASHVWLSTTMNNKAESFEKTRAGHWLYSQAIFTHTIVFADMCNNCAYNYVYIFNYTNSST